MFFSILLCHTWSKAPSVAFLIPQSNSNNKKLWLSKRIWSWSPAMNTSKIHLPVEQFSLKINWKLAEGLLYHQDCKMPTHQDRRGLKRHRDRKAVVSCLGPLCNLIFRQKGRANYILMDLLLSFFPNSQWLSRLLRQPANPRIALFTLPTQLSVEGSIF